ncbi:MAG: M48 family metallopeptidase [Coriobacteriia bacterium]|nr:M48 family metallopeptidase [Coriobacteriia bacterium]
MEIIYSDRKTLAIEVKSSTKVVVRAPGHMSEARIMQWTDSRREWIARAQEKLAVKEELAGPPLTISDVARLKADARVDFATRISYWKDIIGVHPVHVTIRNQSSRWGSCSARKTISLNCQLMRFDERERDYVIVHELCHLKEFNHGRRFRALVKQYFPEYLLARKTLSEALILKVEE